jgi:hypothetical protein
MQEGKDPMTFELYNALCLESLRSEKREDVFAHLFLTLQWNLMARSDSIASLRHDHISSFQDALTVFFVKSKTDQEGEKVRPRHVYGNPVCPAICCILALAIFWLIFPPKSADDPLFAGGKQCQRKCEIVHLSLVCTYTRAA